MILVNSFQCGFSSGANVLILILRFDTQNGRVGHLTFPNIEEGTQFPRSMLAGILQIQAILLRGFGTCRIQI